MSRNLRRTNCAQCDGAVMIVGEQRTETRKSLPVERFVVADAECTDCGTQYLAWITHVLGNMKRSVIDGETHFDLSYHSTFDDEPGDSDIGIDPAVARAKRAHREIERATYEQCIEVAEMWMDA